MDNFPSEEGLGMFSRGQKPVIVALVALMMVVLLTGTVLGSSVGRIKGTVTDGKTGETMTGVTVMIKGSTYGAKTDINGSFVILSIPPGTYTLTFSAVGYNKMEMTDVEVSTDQTTERNIQMKSSVVDIGTVTTVTGKLKGLDFNQTGTVSVKTQQAIRQAPVASVQDLLSHETGVTVDPEGQLHFRGGRAGEATYLVDGVNYSDPLGGKAPVDAGINISSSSVLELEVIKDGFDPEYGEALSGVVKITSPTGSVEKTRTHLMFQSDDFGTHALNKYSENYDRLEFTISGPDPALTNRIFPALGIDYFKGKDFTYWIFSDARKTDTQTPYERYNSPSTQKTYTSYSLLGIGIPDRQDNLYHLEATLAYDPISNMHVKALFKGMWSNGTDFSWLYRYTPSTSEIYTYNTKTFSLQMRQNPSPSTDYEINLSYWGSRFVLKPGDPSHPGQGLNPDQFLYSDQYESYVDANKNNKFDSYEPFINLFPDTVKQGATYIPNYNYGDIDSSTDDQAGGVWNLYYDLNNNGIIDKYSGEPYVDLNGNGVWDRGDTLTTDINGNGIYDEIYRDVTTPTQTSREEPYHDGDSSLGEPYTDVNRNGVYDEGIDRFIIALDTAANDDKNRNNRYDGPRDTWEPGIDYIDYNQNGVYDAPNNKYDPGEVYEDINKNGLHDLGGTNSTAFLLYGFSQADNSWTLENVDKYTVKGNLKKAIGRAHEIKAGMEFRSEKVAVSNIEELQYRNDTDDGYPYPGHGSVRDFYSRNPKILVMYFRDKIEYGTLVASLGLRGDIFFQSALKGSATILNVTGQSLKKIHNKVSPRVSINYPISDRAMVLFNYGHFYELPDYTRMYRDANPFQGGNVPVAGNPNLDYTKTVNYTFGVNYAITDEYSVKLSGYYKDYFNIINTSTYYVNGIARFSYYDNTDYARVRGFELELSREASRLISGSLSYEYAFAYGKSSTDAENYQLLLARQAIAIDENPLAWDIRHKINLWLQMYVTNREHPKLFGLSIPNDWDMSVLWKFQTGYPFTPAKTYPNMVLDVGESPGTNSMRLPSTAQTDIKFHKRFHISGMDYSFELQINNLFNNKNVLTVYTATGRADTDQNSGSGTIYGGTSFDSNPANWGRGRQILVGLSLDF